MLSSAFALASALAIGASTVAPLSELSLGAYALAPPRRPDLAVHLAATGGRDLTPLVLADEVRRVALSGGPVCSGDVCAPVVTVPGFEPSYGRAHRSEAFVALLTRAHVEPLASLAWALVATGLRFDYTPVAFDGTNANAHGWGSVNLRLRLRLDAHNSPVIPPRPR